MFATQLYTRAAMVFSALALFLAAPASAQATDPSAISPGAWSEVRAAYEANQHAIAETAVGFEARNPGLAWSIHFDGRGVLVEPDRSEWVWGLELAKFGFAGDSRDVGRLASTNAKGGRVTYTWDNVLDEWYVNDERGLEHGFTVHQRPECNEGGEHRLLELRLRVRGELSPVVSADRHNVRFVESNGGTALDYSGLTAFDAEGRVLSAWFDSGPDGLVLLVDERDAQYPITIDPIAQEAYLKASNASPFIHFGRSVAISADTLVVGAPLESNGATGVNGNQNGGFEPSSGAAYVFVRNGTVWTQQAYIKASNTANNDNFGWSVALSGDTLAVGARNEGSDATGIGGDQFNNNAPHSGAVYVFTRSGTSWSQQAYVKASNSGGTALVGDYFGTSVSLSGDTLVVGAVRESSSATGVNGDQANNDAADSGAAYVFVRTGTTWSQQAYLKASNTDASDGFGVSVSVSGDRLVVGANGEASTATGVDGDQGDNGNFGSGAAYVFNRSGTSWTQEAYLKASNSGGVFGASVSISGDTLAVGAAQEGSNATGIDGNQDNSLALDSGAAYVFVRGASTWSQQAYVKASNTESWDSFGAALALSGDRLVVGATGEDSSASGFGGPQGNNTATNSGAAFVFARSGSTWSQEAYLKASNTGFDDEYGHATALAGGTVVVGAWREDSDAQGVGGSQSNNLGPNSGAAYVINLDFIPPVLPRAGIALCSGDGGDQLGCTNCPCMNNAVPGTVGGCLGSAGSSARLDATGSVSVSLPPGQLSDLRFAVTGAPGNSLCLLNSGDAVAPASMVNPCFGLNSGAQAMQFDGLRCAVMNTRRHGGRSADANGQVGIDTPPWGGEGQPAAGIAVAGDGFIAGQTRYFQVIYRDDPLASCMRGLNTSQAVEVTLTP